MKKGYTHLSIVLDRSGSMTAICDDAQGGLNMFLQSHRNAAGETTLTLAQFDHLYELVHDMKPLDDVDNIHIEPRGHTALLDAIGRTIHTTGDRLSGLSEDQRPEHVFFVIITDGYENASHEYSKQQVRQMIELQRGAYNWHFVFLGADIDAFAEAGAVGIPKMATLRHGTGGQQVNAAYGATAAATHRVRSGQSQTMDFNDEERESAS